jgi:acyl-coenzyme A thioesterase PaaI-like protein
MAPFQAHLAGGQDERTLADGAIVTLLDMAGTLSIFAKLGRFRPHATVELRIDSLAVAPAGSGILARAECYHIASRIAFVRGVARTEENLEIARLAATYMFATQ